MTLYPYQSDGAKWLARRTHALLADEPGLGKTRQAIAALVTPALVVCPAVCKSVWANEIALVRPGLRVQVLSGRDARPDFVHYDVAVVNYDILPHGGYIDSIDTLIADEAHALSSSKSARSTAFRAMSRRAKRVWLLTGTPMTSDPGGLWSVLQSARLGHLAFESYEQFLDMFGGKRGTFGIEWGTPRPESREHLSRVMLRRTRAEVLPQLPAKTHQIVPVQLPARVAKKHEAADHLIPLDMLPRDIGRFSELRQVTAAAKIPAALQLIEQFEGTPLVVFSAHSEPVQKIGSREGWAIIDGNVPSEKRGEIVARFQQGELHGIAANIKAAGVGITLTHASNAIFVDQEWTPALNMQAEDRICRIGQHSPCNYMHLVGETRLEYRVWSILNSKQQTMETAGI